MKETSDKITKSNPLKFTHEKRNKFSHDNRFACAIDATCFQITNQWRIVNIAKLTHARQVAQMGLKWYGIAYIMPSEDIVLFNQFRVAVVQEKYLI